MKIDIEEEGRENAKWEFPCNQWLRADTKNKKTLICDLKKKFYIQIMEARDLPAVDTLTGTHWSMLAHNADRSDPFVKVRYGTQTAVTQFQTSTVNPVFFNSLFALYVALRNFLLKQHSTKEKDVTEIQLEICDWNLLEDDEKIGAANLRLG